MKKTFSSLRDVLYAIVLFSFVFLVFDSCKKSHPPGGQAAQGSLQGVDGNCLPGAVHGTWYAGVTTGGDTNYVEIGVNAADRPSKSERCLHCRWYSQLQHYI